MSDPLTPFEESMAEALAADGLSPMGVIMYVRESVRSATEPLISELRRLRDATAEARQIADRAHGSCCNHCDED